MSPFVATQTTSAYDHEKRPQLSVVTPGSFALAGHLQELCSLKGIENLLSWDQEVYMPRAGAQERATQLEWVSRQIHRRLTDPAFCEHVDGMIANPGALSQEDAALGAMLKRLTDRERRLPEPHVAEKTMAASLAYSAWLEARERSDFSIVAPHLARLVRIARREADLIGYSESPYDALLSNYEPGSKLAIIKPLLLRLACALRPIVQQLSERYAREAPVAAALDEQSQARVCKRVLADLGFDFETGRLDETAHPFQSTIGARDVRIATNYDRGNLLSSVLGALHEAGHAFYELGLPHAYRGTLFSSILSFGLHESQSRLWENKIGRSRAFSSYLHRVLSEHAPDKLAVPSAEDLWRSANRVTPSLIRTDADEVTYSLHIVIRMLLEEALITGELEVKDLPRAWRELYDRYLGVEPVHDGEGVLQDAHWFSGDLGYFPSYAMGDLYAACLGEAMKRSIPCLDVSIANGDFGPVRNWLASQIHEKGLTDDPRSLVSSVIGSEVSEEPLLRYIRQKHSI